jgi:hypothetical protein
MVKFMRFLEPSSNIVHPSYASVLQITQYRVERWKDGTLRMKGEKSLLLHEDGYISLKLFSSYHAIFFLFFARAVTIF